MQLYFLGRPDQPAPSGTFDSGSTVFGSLEAAQQQVTGEEDGDWRQDGFREWLFFPTGSTTPTWQIDHYGSGSSPYAAISAARLTFD